MSLPVVVLHGYTQNGALVAAEAAPLFAGFPLLPVTPDAPFACDPTSGGDPAKAPHLTWWRATDDGSVYAGWEQARDRVRAALEAHPGAAVLGFSQGAMLAAAVAAWSVDGSVPPIRGVVLVAGRVPRAIDLQPLFARPIPVPSLHVVGARDPMAPLAPELAARFAGAETVGWGGPHVLPTRGSAAEAIRAFLLRLPPRP